VRYEIPAAVFSSPQSAVRLADAENHTIAILNGPGVIESDQPLTWEVIDLPQRAEPNASVAAEEELAQSDIEMGRVVEDLIALLVSNGTITLGDLPETAQSKLSQRQELRSQLVQGGAAQGGRLE
jgi:hypothetical protein